MKVLVNYANSLFRQAQEKNSATGRQMAAFDQVLSFGPQDIDSSFVARNRRVLDIKRGNGLWLWKPYFICRVLDELADSDFLFYCDSGAYFLAPIDPLLALCDKHGQDVIPFELPFPESDWTKRDAFVLLGCDSPEFVQTRQRLASFHAWRKSDRSMRLAREWLELAQDERLIGDSANQCGLTDYPGFEEHRWDQSIFSLLTKKHRLAGFRNPSQHGNRSRERYPHCTYPQLIEHTRDRRHSLMGGLWRRLWGGVKRLSTRRTAAAEQVSARGGRAA